MKKLFQLLLMLVIVVLSSPASYAHNGSIAHAYPLPQIKIDGNLSEWPRNLARYPIAMHMSDEHPLNAADFSGFFQVGYRLSDGSLYIAFTINDQDFIEDTSASVQYNTQDCLELCLDARHLQKGSGVVSFMYSKKLRNMNKAFYDPFANAANWDIMEVAMTRSQGKRYYEWKIKLDKELQVGKSIGFDFMVFDKDNDKSFSFAGWGAGGSKYMIRENLGDVLILPANTKFATVNGSLVRAKDSKAPLPQTVRLTSESSDGFWFDAKVDSLGNYSAKVPAGRYGVTIPVDYVYDYEAMKVFPTGNNMAHVTIKAGEVKKVAHFTLPSEEAPDLLPEKGLLHDFTLNDTSKVDNFIESYQKYYMIPGVSFAMIKDGRVVYHKTYGLKNTMTGEKVNPETLFEAASITKPVFSFAVLRLADRGEIDLDKPLYLYLPYKDIEHDERYKLITARHVLTHRTGFPNWRNMTNDGTLQIKFTPGTDYGYSGEGFEYLKMVVEKITGKKVEQVLQEEVIEPMGLYHTFFSKNDSLQRVVANGHYNTLPSRADLPESPGMAYSMHTEALTFTKFMLYMLEEKGLKPETYKMVFSKGSDFKFDPGDPVPPYPVYMGTSLEIQETPFGKSFGHGGNNGDFTCQFEMYKDAKMGYVIFTNSNTSHFLLQGMRKFLVLGK
jgi:hypothetical protein